MGVTRWFWLLAITVFFVPQLVAAGVEYRINSELSNTDTAVHGGQKTVRYTFSNVASWDEVDCPVSCSVRLTSSYRDTSTKSIYLPKGDTEEVVFTVSAPSKSESGYEPYDDVQYALVTDCSKEDTLLCSSGEVIPDAKSDSKTFTLNYGLSSSEAETKEDYVSLASSLRGDIENAYNRANELESYYQNLRGNVKIPESVRAAVEEYITASEDAKAAFDESQEESSRLDYFGAYSTLSEHQSTDFSGMVSDVQDTYQELSDLQQRHDTVVNRMRGLNADISDASEELQRVGLEEEYLDLVEDYESLESDISSLSFSSYNDVESEVDQLEGGLESLQSRKQDMKQDLHSRFNTQVSLETAKIGSEQELTSQPTVSSMIETFCNLFEERIPQQFREFNEARQAEVDAQIKENEERNRELESMRSSWRELRKLLGEIEATAANATFDAELASGCDVSELQEDDFSSQDVHQTLDTCNQFKQDIESSIEKNQDFGSQFVNFFKYIFADKPVLQQEDLSALDSFKKPTDLEYTPVTFDEKTNSMISQHCSYNPRTITLSNPREVEDIGFEASNEGIEFSTVAGACEEIDCYNNRNTFPILFVHGHMFQESKDPMEESRYSFDEMISHFANKYPRAFDAGTVVNKGSEFLDSGLKHNAGVALFRTTYYGDAYIDSSGELQFEKKNYESITVYAEKLQRIIDSTLEATGRKKVKLVAHSMGGLVVREYMRIYGSDKVDTVVMIGTPHGGVVGAVERNCDDALLGLVNTGATTECDEMGADSAFIERLYQNDRLPSRAFTLIGVYSNAGHDGIVLKESADLPSTTNFVFTSDRNSFSSPSEIEGIWSKIGSDLLHSELVEPDSTPEVTQKVAELVELDD